MREELKRFVLRNRPAIGGLLLVVVLATLTILTLLYRDGAGEPEPPAGEAGTPDVQAPATSASSVDTARLPAGSPARPLADPDQGEADASATGRGDGGSRTRRAKNRTEAGSPGAGPARSLQSLGSAPVRIAGPRESTVILGEARARVEGDRIAWSLLVLENGLTHGALALRLGSGSEDEYWMLAEAPPHDGQGPFRVRGEETLPGEVLRALEGKRKVAGRVAGFRQAPEGRILMAAADVEVVLTSTP